MLVYLRITGVLIKLRILNDLQWERVAQRPIHSNCSDEEYYNYSNLLNVKFLWAHLLDAERSRTLLQPVFSVLD